MLFRKQDAVTRCYKNLTLTGKHTFPTVIADLKIINAQYALLTKWGIYYTN